MLNWIIWIILGILAGFVAGKLFSGHGHGLIVNLILGVARSILGGWLFSLLGGSVTDAFSLKAFLVAVGGAVVILFIFKLLRGK